MRFVRIVTWMLFCAALAAAQGDVDVVVSTNDLSQRWARRAPVAPEAGDAEVVLTLDAARTGQTMLGMGSSLEPATAYNLSLLDEEARAHLMRRLLDAETGAGMNLMRISIGTPDFTGDPWYSYNDLADGETDEAMERFSIEKDRRYILPALRLARRVNPELLFFASPWSPPGWMKTTKSLIGGSLEPRYYAAYARYFVRFIQEYEKEGIPIYAVTIQNEPGVDRAVQAPRWHYPSCRWTGEQERDFVRDHLGPALAAAGLKTRVWAYDHNYNETPKGMDPGLEYPATVLRDAGAARHVSGVAFHGYEGTPAGMDVFHRMFPKVPLHFTEGSVFGVRGALKLVDILRNHASSYNAWVTMLDDERKPNNGPFRASRTLITYERARREVDYHNDYYFYGQFMKFVERGAVRFEVEGGNDAVRAVAFRNPQGGRVLVVVNAGDAPVALRVSGAGAAWRDRLPAAAVATYRWRD
jgi:glucosylceramidase